MICANCDSPINPTVTGRFIVPCSKCGASMHKECAFQCVKCGKFLCDSCAITQKYLCDECYELKTIKMEYISATMFEAYEKCPYAFKHEHVLNTFTEAERENKYSALGTLLHSLFDKYSKIRPLNLEKRRAIEDEYDKGFDAINVKLFDSMPDMNDFRQRGLITMNNWFVEEIERPVPLHTEKEHFFEVPGIDIPIRATIDRINGTGDDSSEWEVEDYKTGKVYSSDMLRHNFQLPIYALAIREVYGKPPKSLRLRFPQHKDKTGTIQQRIFERVTDDIYVCNVRRGGTYSFSINERIGKMIEIYNKIKHDSFPLNTSNQHFCDNFCVLAKRGMCDGLSTKWQIANQRGY